MEVVDLVTPELRRIQAELKKLKEATIHVGIQGIPGKDGFQKGVPGSKADLLTIARVHEYGAVIKAVNAKNLTIPVNKKAYGKRVSDFPDLFYIRSKRGYLLGCISSRRKGHSRQDPQKLLNEPQKPLRKPRKPNKKKKYKTLKESGVTILFLLLPSVKIPERSFLRGSYDNGKDALAQVCREELWKVVQGGTAEQAANAIGSFAVKMVKNYVNDSGKLREKGSIMKGLFPKNKKPLVQSGNLLNAVTYVIEGL